MFFFSWFRFSRKGYSQHEIVTHFHYQNLHYVKLHPPTAHSYFLLIYSNPYHQETHSFPSPALQRRSSSTRVETV